MQCLFCGKELALLKRLRGGGEFCSEAHRKEYQDQYEQLALARLMQAKPPAEHLPPGALGSTASAESDHWSNIESERPYDAAVPAPAFVATLATVAPTAAQVPAREIAREHELQPAAQRSSQSNPAPLAGFVMDPVIPAVTLFQQAGLESEHAWERVSHGPSIAAVAAFANSEPPAPSRMPEGPPPAARVDLALSLQALDHHTRGSERGMELREFTGPAPVIELHLRPETGSEPAGAHDVMEILMSPHPPQKAKPWLGVPRGFPAAPAELGGLARLDFATSGFAYSDGPAAVPPNVAPQVAVLAAEVPQAPPKVLKAPPETSAKGEPAPEAFTAPAELSPAVSPVAPEPPPPALITRVLPLTLHGLAAGPRKLSQPFPRAIAAASDVQMPASESLPLRPVIVLGPSPAPVRAPEPAAASAKTAPVQLKQAQPEVAPPKQAQPKQLQPERPQPQPVQQVAAAPKPAERSPSVVPEPKPAPMKRPAPAEVAVREQHVASQTSASPSLHLETAESAWSKLSTGVKIGVAAAVIVGVSGIGYLVTRGNKPAPDAPVAVSTAPTVATGVAISGGWIDDWANSARTKRHISVLSGSAKLSDYRLEFQAQIETKAIGWIFRGLNPRNYYVTKLEIVTPGLQPTIALVHFAVVDGQDENRVVVPLHLKVRVDTTYKIRFDAIGNHFSTWIQDQKVDEWSDSRFGSGGVGFFSERDEQAAMQGSVNVVPLIPKN